MKNANRIVETLRAYREFISTREKVGPTQFPNYKIENDDSVEYKTPIFCAVEDTSIHSNALRRARNLTKNELSKFHITEDDIIEAAILILEERKINETQAHTN